MKTEIIGMPPNQIGPKCATLTAQDVRRCLDAERYRRYTPVPGRCRFCSADLGVTHQDIGDGDSALFRMPILQCDTAAKLWPEAEAISQKRIQNAKHLNR